MGTYFDCQHCHTYNLHCVIIVYPYWNISGVSEQLRYDTFYIRIATFYLLVQELSTSYEKCPIPCNVDITISEDFTGDVYFYYGLSNFYQNHRRYMKSRNDKQLLGYLDVS